MGESVWQDAEKVCQLRSQLIEILNVPPRVRLRFRLACRPCWSAFLSILRDVILLLETWRSMKV
jgi:hypothetical protein